MLSAPAHRFRDRFYPGAAARRGNPVERPLDLARGRRRRGKPLRGKCFGEIEPPVPVRLVGEPFAQGQPAGSERIVERDHPVGQFAHRHAEEAPRAERGEIDLEAVRGAEGIDRHRAGEQPGGEVAEPVVVAGQPAKADREGLAETDDQRDGERSRFHLAEMAGRGFAISGQPGYKAAEPCRRRTSHHFEIARDVEGRAVVGLLGVGHWHVRWATPATIAGARRTSKKRPAGAGRFRLPETRLSPMRRG